MFFSGDVDTIPPQDLEQYKTPEHTIVIQQTVDDYRQRYMDILQDGSGDVRDVQEMSYEQAQEMMNGGGDDVKESLEKQALNNFAGFLDDLEKKKYSQEEAGSIVQHILKHVLNVDVVKNGEKSYNDVYKDILLAYESYENSSVAQDIFVEIVKEDPRLFSFAPDGENGLIPFTIESLTSLSETVSMDVMEAYLFFDKEHTEDQKKIVMDNMKQKIGAIAPLLEQTTIPRFDRLKIDPSFPLFEKVHELGVSGVGFEKEIQSDRGKIQLEVMIARNMHQQGIDADNVTQADIQKAEKEIQDMREDYKSIEFFSGRDVEVFADYEVGPHGDQHFGKDRFVQDVQSQGGDVSRYRPINGSAEKAQELKSNMLDVLGSPDKASKTFVFDMHGEEGGGGLMLNAGVYISAQEMFDAYIQRWEGGADTQQEDIFILNACFSHRMIMSDFYPMINEYNKTHEIQIPTPIFVFGAEYFQYGVLDFDSPYGSYLYENTLDLKSSENTTIQNIIENEAHQKHSNPSLYVPNPQNIPVQIAELEGGGSGNGIV